MLSRLVVVLMKGSRLPLLKDQVLWISHRKIMLFKQPLIIAVLTWFCLKLWIGLIFKASHSIITDLGSLGKSQQRKRKCSECTGHWKSHHVSEKHFFFFQKELKCGLSCGSCAVLGAIVSIAPAYSYIAISYKENRHFCWRHSAMLCDVF